MIVLSRSRVKNEVFSNIDEIQVSSKSSEAGSGLFQLIYLHSHCSEPHQGSLSSAWFEFGFLSAPRLEWHLTKRLPKKKQTDPDQKAQCESSIRSGPQFVEGPLVT